MALAKRWRDLERSTVGRAPERYGVYELGDAEGNVVGVDYGVLRRELKEALAYHDAEQVRWEVAEHEDHARELAKEHRD